MTPKELKAIVVVIAAGVVLAACVNSSEASYTPPPPGYIQYGSGKTPVKPDKFAVNPKNYPEFTVEQTLQPPSAPDCGDEFRDPDKPCPPIDTAAILPSDVWQVTHVFGGRYLVESKAYNERECRLLRQRYGNNSYVFVNPWNQCLRDYNFAVYIQPTGEISGGWELLPGPRKALASRYMYMSYDPSKNVGWPAGVVFRPSPPATDQNGSGR